MQGFRPPAVIAEDTELAIALRGDDEVAIRTLVDRYGAAVTAVTTKLAGDEIGRHVVPDVFVQAWRNSEWFEPGRDFGPWLLSLAARSATRRLDTALDVETSSELERVWEVTMSTAGLDADRRELLRVWCVDGGDPADSELAHDLKRIERRTAHLVREPEPTGAFDSLLADPAVWLEADAQLPDRVVQAVGSEARHGERFVSEVGSEHPGAKTARTFRSVIVGLGSAMAVLVVAVVGLSALGGAPQSADFTAELVPTGVIVEVEPGEITVTERAAGVEIKLDAPTLPRRAGGLLYRGVLVLDDGTEVTAGSFSEGFDVTLFAGVSLDRVATFRVVLDAVDESFDGGDVVLKADVPAN